MAEAEDDDLDVGDVGELQQEALGGAEEQLAVEAVGDAASRRGSLDLSVRGRSTPYWP